MVTVYKVVRVQLEEEREVGGTSAGFLRGSRYCLSYRKDRPTIGRFPLYAFEDLASAKAWAGKSSVVTIWEAEAPSSYTDAGYCGDNVWDVYIEEFWAHWTSRPGEWSCIRLFEEAWDCMLTEKGYHTQTTPAGTVLCSSITLRRLLEDPIGQQDIPRLSDEAHQLVTSQCYEDALVVVERVLRLDPTHAHAHRYKVFALGQLGRSADALAASSQAIQLHPNDPTNYFNQGHALRDLKRYEEALTAYEQFLRLAPQSAEGYFSKGVVLARNQRSEEALLAFEQALLLNSADAASHYEKGQALIALERDEEAVVALDQALHRRSGSMTAHRRMDARIQKGRALLRLGRYEEALAAFKQGLRLDSENADAREGKDLALQALKGGKARR